MCDVESKEGKQKTVHAMETFHVGLWFNVFCTHLPTYKAIRLATCQSFWTQAAEDFDNVRPERKNKPTFTDRSLLFTLVNAKLPSQF